MTSNCHFNNVKRKNSTSPNPFAYNTFLFSRKKQNVLQRIYHYKIFRNGTIDHSLVFPCWQEKKIQWICFSSLYMNFCAFIVKQMMSQVEFYFGQSTDHTCGGAVMLFTHPPRSDPGTASWIYLPHDSKITKMLSDGICIRSF